MTNLTDAYLIKKNSPTRHKNDYYPTPPLATQALMEYVAVPDVIWEPAAGRGWISKTLEDNGHKVYSSDLHHYNNLLTYVWNGCDFLKTERLPFSNIEGIVTNPPYKLATEFVVKALQHSDFVAMFLRLTFMESVKRYNKIFKNNPPDVFVFSGRVNCQEEKFGTLYGETGGMMGYAWFVWNKRSSGQVEWIDPDYTKFYKGSE